MADSFSGSRHKCVPVDCPELLGSDAECVVSGPYVTLRDVVLGTEVSLSFWDLVERRGRMLRFCSRYMRMPGHAIEFAGLGGIASFHVTCQDEATAEELAGMLDRPSSRESLFDWAAARS
jgi:hypothetical protein